MINSSPKTEPEQLEVSPMNTPHPGALRVLVVDDNADARQSMCLLLDLLGYTAQEAASGKAALQLAAPSPPDVVLLDINMPGLDGYEVARGLRALPGGEGILLVAVTGIVDEELLLLGRPAGFDFYLPKPVELPLLEELLRNHQLARR
jgi:CheY-like chemotaxis protein